MQFIRCDQTPEHLRGTNHRVGTFRFRDLGQGRPGDPGNFYLRIVGSSGDFFSPRHRHNFDQVRVQLSGRFAFGQDGTMEPGCIGYFPEGTPYGPQTSAEDTLQLVLQIGGPSGSGYLGEQQRQAAVDALARVGRFEDGRYFAPGDATSTGVDAFEAAWEHAMQRRVRYPQPRFERPLLIHPEAFAWQDVPGATGVRLRTLWDFGTRTVGCQLWRLGPGARSTARGPASWVLRDGRATVESPSLASEVSPLDALHLAHGESAVLAAACEATFLAFPHPVFAPDSTHGAQDAPHQEATS
jgi:hypothetical protein